MREASPCCSSSQGISFEGGEDEKDNMRSTGEGGSIIRYWGKKPCPHAVRVILLAGAISKGALQHCAFAL